MRVKQVTVFSLLSYMHVVKVIVSSPVRTQRAFVVCQPLARGAFNGCT